MGLTLKILKVLFSKTLSKNLAYSGLPCRISRQNLGCLLWTRLGGWRRPSSGICMWGILRKLNFYEQLFFRTHVSVCQVHCGAKVTSACWCQTYAVLQYDVASIVTYEDFVNFGWLLLGVNLIQLKEDMI